MLSRETLPERQAAMRQRTQPTCVSISRGEEEVIDNETGRQAALEAAFEPHFKCKELANRWGMSVTTVTNLFADEPGVAKIGGRNSRKRTKVTLFVPLSVAQRVYANLLTA
jgi:hypothetical protein